MPPEQQHSAPPPVNRESPRADASTAPDNAPVNNPNSRESLTEIKAREKLQYAQQILKGLKLTVEECLLPEAHAGSTAEQRKAAIRNLLAARQSLLQFMFNLAADPQFDGTTLGDQLLSTQQEMNALFIDNLAAMNGVLSGRNDTIDNAPITAPYSDFSELPPDDATEVVDALARRWNRQARSLLSSSNPKDPTIVANAEALVNEVQHVLNQIAVASVQRITKEQRTNLEAASARFTNVVATSIEQLKKMVSFARVENRPVEELSYEELVNECRRLRIDQVKSGYAGGPDEGRRSDLLNAYIKRMREYAETYIDEEGVERYKFPDGEERIRLDALRTRYALERLTGAADKGKGEAAIPRDGLMDRMPQYSIKREDILRVMYNPEWGAELRNALTTSLQDALTGTFKLRRSGEIFNYDNLTTENGNDYLEQYFLQKFPKAKEEVRKFAQLLFVAFDFLTMLLQEKQKRAQGTRLHNKADKFESIAATNPQAAYVHGGFRYWNPGDWRGHSMGLVQPIAGMGYFQEKKNKDDIVEKNYDIIIKAQELAYAYIDCFIDFERVVKPLLAPVKGPLESVFPSALEIIQLQGEEVLDMVGDHSVNAAGVRTKPRELGYNAPTPKELTGWEDIQGSMDAWIQILTLFYSAPPDSLTEATILFGSGTNKGLLSKITSLAGVAKGFRPRHLKEMFAPLLLQYSLELITSADVDQKGKEDLIHAMVENISNSPGIDRFIATVNQPVSQALSHPSVKSGWSGRPKQVEKYCDLYAEFYHIKKRGQTDKWFGNMDAHQEELWRARRGDIAPPRPFNSAGTLESEKKSEVAAK